MCVRSICDSCSARNIFSSLLEGQPSSIMTRRIAFSCDFPRATHALTTLAGMLPRGSALCAHKQFMRTGTRRQMGAALSNALLNRCDDCTPRVSCEHRHGNKKACAHDAAARRARRMGHAHRYRSATVGRRHARRQVIKRHLALVQAHVTWTARADQAAMSGRGAALREDCLKAARHARLLMTGILYSTCSTVRAGSARSTSLNVASGAQRFQFAVF